MVIYRSNGSSSGIGLKGHLQTAVPPLIPSSKVTALPKRRQSLGTPTTPPCSATSALFSVTTAPSMTVQGALYTQEAASNKSEHGRVEPALDKSTCGFEHEHKEHHKATLYSSQTSSKATLYRVNDSNFQAFYDTVNAPSGNFYGSVSSGSVDNQYSITTAPAISFYGSTKHQESDSHPEKVSSAGFSINTSAVSSSISSTLKEHQDPQSPPKSNAQLSKESGQ